MGPPMPPMGGGAMGAGAPPPGGATPPPPMPMPPPPATRKRGMKVKKAVTRKTSRKGKARTAMAGRKVTRKIRGS